MGFGNDIRCRVYYQQTDVSYRGKVNKFNREQVVAMDQPER